ncbi:MAG: aldose 1-epimerase family protein [Aerococcus sp.]|nr:aldose 1-epimerase family protein [Aerococcus sp.]
MDYLLANDELTISASTNGAQLESIRRNDQMIEYLYQGFPEFWSWQAPILFPHVGGYKDNYMEVDGKRYTSPRHGFARHSLYQVESVQADQITFLLEDSPATHESYPYAFALRITYQLVGDAIKVTYQVTNNDDKTIHFSIGAHPAFNVPLTPDKDWADYEITFSQSTLKQYQMDDHGLYRPEATETIAAKPLALTRELFKNDALIFETDEHMTVTLSDHTHGIELDMGDHPLIGIWSPYPAEAPFVCLEPWQGITDPTNATHQLADKPFDHTLAVGESFTTSYTIRPF